jgi:hypothetical protein
MARSFTVQRIALPSRLGTCSSHACEGKTSRLVSPNRARCFAFIGLVHLNEPRGFADAGRFGLISAAGPLS